MASIFTKIVKGDIPCYKVWEDEKHLAFLDIGPWVEGHTLVVPKKEIDYLFGMHDEAYLELMYAARHVAGILQDRLRPERVCMAVMGYEVPHAHIHLLPTNGPEEFPPPRERAANGKKDLEEMLKRLTG